VDAPLELLALARSEISTQAYGDLRSDTGVSMPNSVREGKGRKSLAQRKLGQLMAAFIQEGMRGTGGSKADPRVSEKPTI
jgi:hypothetical protein